jgi:hypothetical protein
MAPISSRKADIVYLIFFIINVPAMLLVDLGELYPEQFKPSLINTIKQFYVNTYQDQFFISPPLWFSAYTYLELFIHLPTSLWAIKALIQGKLASF